MGFSAARISGACAMCQTPSPASTANHTDITGPKKVPTEAVPWRWIMNRTQMMASVTGTT